MSAQGPGAPHLAKLVLQGEGQAEAVAITGFIFMARDISNAYLVTTADGDVMVNIGFLTSGARNKAVLAPHRTGALRHIILTQSHADHYGALDSFREPETKIIVQAQFLENMHDMNSLQPFFGPRTRKLWGTTVKFDGPPPRPPEVVPDIIVDKEYVFEQGGRRFEILSTPDGETTDSLTVWMPKEKVVFTGNLFGPVFLSMPFLNTLRGDKPRLVRTYLKSLDTVRQLGAEILITGHGEPIVGTERIRTDLDRMHAAVSWVRDYTLAGMKAGKDVHALMREVKLPDEIRIGEFHGKVSWAVKSIWEEYSGWFHYDSTTSLYGVPRSSVDADVVAMAGGTEVIAARARARLDEGKPLEAIHLVEIVLGVEPKNVNALTVKRDASARLLELSGGTNLSETMWLRSEIREIEERLGK
ncbi:MAG TPA: alkyl sulfatase dimerization domain-containing protein [Acidocella sp.]|nr:alkyl sulfatase dimerization domain-containing protein [Acidocella sp.]